MEFEKTGVTAASDFGRSISWMDRNDDDDDNFFGNIWLFRLFRLDG